MGGQWSSYCDDEDKEALLEVLEGNHTFTLKLYQALAKGREGDVCFAAPLLQHALAALLAPASTPAAASAPTTAVVEGLASSLGERGALARLVRPAPDHRRRRRAQRGYGALHSYLHSMKDVTMATAMRIYSSNAKRLVKDWCISSLKHYFIYVKPTNFSKPHEELCTAINNWVKSKTKNRIEQMMPVESVNGTVQQLLICAAYFQCSLEHPFSTLNTTNDIFYVTAEDTRIVKLMHQINIYRYAEFDNLKCQAVEIPYENPNLRFIMLLPFTVDGLNTLEDNLLRVNFIDLLTQMVNTKVLVSVPSFRLQEGYNICNYLDQEDPSKALSHLNHMLFFEFMEDIIETGSKEVTKVHTDIDTIVFRADHPFIFTVIDICVNMILVFGRINCFTRFTTPVFQKVALKQLDEQRQQYLDDQSLLITEQRRAETTVFTRTGMQNTFDVDENKQGKYVQVRFS